MAQIHEQAVPDDEIPTFEGFPDQLPIAQRAAMAEARKLRKLAQQDERKNTMIYVRGLPPEITKGQLYEFAAKAGIIKKHADTGEFLVRLYYDADGQPKGDGTVTYLKPGSIPLAMTILDGDEIEKGYPVQIQEASFDKNKADDPPPSTAASSDAPPPSSGSTTTTTGPKGKRGKRVPGMKNKNKRKAPQADQASLLSWEDWETRQHIILFGMFDPAEAAGDVDFYKDLKEDIKQEVEKIGPVSLLKVFERNPNGAVAIKFEQGDDAARCIEKMNGRWFAKRQIKAEWYDGVTDYSVKESKQEEKDRLVEWEKFLGGSSDSSDEESEDSDSDSETKKAAEPAKKRQKTAEDPSKSK